MSASLTVWLVSWLTAAHRKQNVSKAWSIKVRAVGARPVLCSDCSLKMSCSACLLFGVRWTLIKGANDQWSFNKNLGFCVPTFNPEDPEPDVSGDDGKWERCEPLPIDNGKISCIGAKCTLFCNEGFMVEGRVNRNGMSRTDCRSINPER